MPITNLRKILERLSNYGTGRIDNIDIDQAEQDILELIPKRVKGVSETCCTCECFESGRNSAISDMKQSMTGER